MKKQAKQAISISLASVSLILLSLCAILPIFSFWSYRLFMTIMLPICIFSFLSVLKGRKSKCDIIGGCAILLVTIILFLLRGAMLSVTICATISFLIAFSMLTQKMVSRITEDRVLSITIVSVFSAIALFVQGIQISNFYTSYEKIASGLYNVPNDMEDSMLTAAFNETGMMIAIACLLLCLVAILIKSSYSTKDDLLSTE